MPTLPKIAGLLLSIVLAACSAAPELRGPDPVDAAPEPIDAGCPDGSEILTVHTAPHDVYGTCSYTCAGLNGPKCDVTGGVCTCPIGFTCDYLPDAGGGTPTVCAPRE